MDLLQVVCRRAVLSGARPTLLSNTASPSFRALSSTPITSRGGPSAIERLRQSLVKRSPGQSSNSALPPRPPAPSILDVVDEIRALAQIPMADSTLEYIAAIRDERNLMKGVQLVECTGVFSDLVPGSALLVTSVIRRCAT